ncbi:hypothetical protein Bbelb_055330 [Branchiostoma belcheri]|nr:hypothetical protein Bbelb_055330 [Branchiostoma belcheri]
MSFLGIELDTIVMEARLPLDKLEKCRDQLASFLQLGSATLRQIQSLAGLLNHVCQVVPPGRAFLRRLIDLTKCQPTPHSAIPITQQSRYTFGDSHRPVPTGVSAYGPTPDTYPKTPGAEHLNRTVTDLLSSALAPSTLRSYRQAWQLFRNFSVEIFGKDLSTPPISTDLLTQFVGFLHNKGFAASSISSKLSAISFVHKLLGIPDPSQSFVIHKLLHAARKSTLPDGRRPITPNILKSLIDTLPSVLASTYDRQLYKTLFLFSFYSFARVSEVTVTSSSNHTLQLSHVKVQTAPVPSLSVTFHTYKHSAPGHHPTISIAAHPDSSYCPVANFNQYLTLRGKCAGCLFLYRSGRPVSSDYFSHILRTCVQHAHLDPRAYTAHSFRIGAATYAAQTGVSDPKLRALGRWSSGAYKKYIRP